MQTMPYSFYIPVMGTGFTIDTPLFVAKYGISSVVSLVDDILIEQMRKFWCEKSLEPYTPIMHNAPDPRAKRITAYLNLLDKLIKKQILALQTSSFAKPESEINRYFTLLPQDHPWLLLYTDMLHEKDPNKKQALQEQLRKLIVAGTIDVNIMTKLDVAHYNAAEQLPYEFCDAAAALRGYAQSDLQSSMVFSAGFNPHLFGYLTTFADFFPDEQNIIKKKICLKVSDYRSAAVQGKYLAKRGIWVSEYRVESALNCGGHAFINDGQLMGPILYEFKNRRIELRENLHNIYQHALQQSGKFCPTTPLEIKITAQGGVGTNTEHEFLLKHYALDAIGWGTPFLLVPEATNVDEITLQKLLHATEKDVFLSTSSPLGIPFWNLRNSPSEEARQKRIEEQKPGSICLKGYLKFNKEFTSLPICRAARDYQTRKLQELAQADLPAEKIALLKQEVLAKSCICHNLAGGVLCKHGIDKHTTPAICPGPNLINFKKIATLKEMIDHIYGSGSLLVNNERPHMFIKDLQLQVIHLLQDLKNISAGLPARHHQKLEEVKENLLHGIEYYLELAQHILQEQQEKFLITLQDIKNEIEEIHILGTIPQKN